MDINLHDGEKKKVADHVLSRRYEKQVDHKPEWRSTACIVR